MERLTNNQAFRAAVLQYLPDLSPWPGVPKTGYPVKTAVGDDGDLKLGFPFSGPRFHAFEDGTILDTVTCRMWVANPNLCGTPIAVDGVAAELNWEDAINACNDLNYAGHTDWRLPNIKELMSLFFIMETGQHIDYNFFTVYNWYYWSSTTYHGDTLGAWCTEWIYGLSYIATKEESELLVLPVRGMPWHC